MSRVRIYVYRSITETKSISVLSCVSATNEKYRVEEELRRSREVNPSLLCLRRVTWEVV